MTASTYVRPSSRERRDPPDRVRTRPRVGGEPESDADVRERLLVHILYRCGVWQSFGADEVKLSSRLVAIGDLKDPSLVRRPPRHRQTKGAMIDDAFKFLEQGGIILCMDGKARLSDSALETVANSGFWDNRPWGGLFTPTPAMGDSRSGGWMRKVASRLLAEDVVVA